MLFKSKYKCNSLVRCNIHPPCCASKNGPSMREQWTFQMNIQYKFASFVLLDTAVYGVAIPGWCVKVGIVTTKRLVCPVPVGGNVKTIWSKQSKVDPEYNIDRSRILPQTLHTAWIFNPNNFLFLELRQSIVGDGLCIYICIPSTAPAEHQSNPANGGTSEKPLLLAIDCFLSWSDSRYTIVNARCKVVIILPACRPLPNQH